MSRIRNIFIIASFILSFIATEGQQNKFAAPSSFPDKYTVYIYQKSNWDGSHFSNIFLYVNDSSKLESFKWNKGDSWSTLVAAIIDWSTFSIRKLGNYRVFKTGKRELFAELEVTEPLKIKYHVGDFSDSMILLSEFWHSYDFDFSGLGFIWRALKNKRDSFSFLIADASFKDNKIGFENKGFVQVLYTSNEVINGEKCFKYKIDGAGLMNKGGFIWINSQTMMIELFRIALPDEEGFKDGQLKLLSTIKMSPEQWNRFIDDKMKEE